MTLKMLSQKQVNRLFNPVQENILYTRCRKTVCVTGNYEKRVPYESNGGGPGKGGGEWSKEK
jgi:hypothetical protein